LLLLFRQYWVTISDLLLYRKRYQENYRFVIRSWPTLCDGTDRHLRFPIFNGWEAWDFFQYGKIQTIKHLSRMMETFTENDTKDVYMNVMYGKKVPKLARMASTFMVRKTVVLAWYAFPRRESMASTIRLKFSKNAYRFKNDKHFKLRLFVLYDCAIRQICG